MRKKLISIAAIATLSATAFSAAQETSHKATILSASDFSKLLKTVPPNSLIDQPLRTIDAGPTKVGLFVVRPPQEADQGCTIEHDTLVNDQTTSILFVLKGAGTIVTGGRLANPTQISNDDPDLKLLGSGSRGGSIQGGVSRRTSCASYI